MRVSLQSVQKGLSAAPLANTELALKSCFVLLLLATNTPLSQVHKTDLAQAVTSTGYQHTPLFSQVHKTDLAQAVFLLHVLLATNTPLSFLKYTRLTWLKKSAHCFSDYQQHPLVCTGVLL